MSTVTVRNATIVTGVELATRARANVIASSVAGQAGIQKSNPASIRKDATPRQSGVDGIMKPSADEDVILDKTPSPTSSTHSSSAASSLSSIAMPSSMSSGSKQQATSVLIRGASKWEGEEQAVDVPEISPSSLDSKFIVDQPRIASFMDSQDEDDDPMIAPSPRTSGLGGRRLSIQVNEVEPTQTSGSSTKEDMSNASVQSLTASLPAPRYPGWVSEVLAPLYSFIDEDVDPNDRFQDKKEIAEGESGLVYQARDLHARAAPSLAGNGEGSGADLVAIKTVDILPSGSAKLIDLKIELEIMKEVKHVNVLTLDGLYVALLDDSLWIKMELMERSLADVIALAQEGVVIQEQVAAKFASDVSILIYFYCMWTADDSLQVVLALIYLQKLGIAHRDIRSDNLLLNKDGVLKIGMVATLLAPFILNGGQCS
jgi:p21-activated kinase 1